MDFNWGIIDVLIFLEILADTDLKFSGRPLGRKYVYEASYDVFITTDNLFINLQLIFYWDFKCLDAFIFVLLMKNFDGLAFKYIWFTDIVTYEWREYFLL